MKTNKHTIGKIALTLALLFSAVLCQAQFLDSFDGQQIEGWFVLTGDGAAEMKFKQHNGFATLHIDASKDKYNVYWTLIKRNVTAFLDLKKLENPDYQLRVEARVRVHNAPRRINFMVNTQRTTDFHIDLMEYDIADTTGWHVISMTTRKFDAVPGDSVFVQMAATDFGPGKYRVDIDYYKADIVNVREAGPDKGVLVPYHPPVPPAHAFDNHLEAAHDGLVNLGFPDVNFGNWHMTGSDGEIRILTVNAGQWALLKWDFSRFKNTEALGPALLELTTHTVSRGGNYTAVFGQDFGMEFGKIRLFEITGGDASWDQHQVTLNSLLQGKSMSDVINGQMIYDAEFSGTPGSPVLFTISQPVLQRLINGTTKGLLILPLGAVDASFYDSENHSGQGPVLHFNVKPIKQTEVP